MRTLVPRVVGQRAARRSTAVRRSSDWTEGEFFEALVADGEDLAPVARSLLDWGHRAPRHIRWGAGKHKGHFHVWIPAPNEKDCKLVSVATTGQVRVHLHLLRKAGFPDDRVEAVLKKLNTIPGVSHPDSAITGMPAMHLSLLSDHAVQRKLLQILEEVTQ